MSTTLKSLAVFLGMLCLHSNEASASNPHQFIDLQAQEMVSIIRNNQELYYKDPELFKAYFVDGFDIGDKKILAKLASKYFMDEKSILRLLDSDNDHNKVSKKDQAARQMGISAVPMFIVAEHYAVSGAQTSDLWKRVIKEIQTKMTIS